MSLFSLIKGAVDFVVPTCQVGLHDWSNWRNMFGCNNGTQWRYCHACKKEEYRRS